MEFERRETHIRVKGESRVKQGLYTKFSLLAALLSGSQLLCASWCLPACTVALDLLISLRVLLLLHRPAGGRRSKEMLPIADG